MDIDLPFIRRDKFIFQLADPEFLQGKLSGKPPCPGKCIGSVDLFVFFQKPCAEFHGGGKDGIIYPPF